MKKSTSRKKVILLLSAMLALIVSMYGFQHLNKEKEEGTTAGSQGTVVFPEFNVEEITKIRIQVDEAEFTFAKTEEKWTLEGEDEFLVDEASLSSILSNARTLTAERTLSDLDNVGVYGLDAPDKVLELTKANGSKLVLKIGMENEVTGQFYVMAEGQSEVFLIGSSLPGLLSADKETYRKDVEATETDVE